MSKPAAIFDNDVEISGNIDISGNINLNGTLTVDGSFSLYGYNIPDPTGENNKVLTISGDGYSWETVQSGSAGDAVINGAGQTFYEIITEQPRAFTAETMTGGALFDNTINTIDICWNFDQLIPFDSESQHLNISGDLNQRVLPCITEIYFEISSNESEYENDIIAEKHIIVNAGHNYNSNSKETGEIQFSKNSTTMNYNLTYKSLNLSITGQDTFSYTVSIYGKNNSNGTDVNKLTYTGLIFKSTGIPEIPTITSIDDSINSNNIISFTINATTTDMDVDTDNTVLSSALYISKLDLSHTLIDSLRSVTYGLPTHDASGVATSITYADNISVGTDTSGNKSISISPTYSSSFYLGSKYIMQARIYNLLNSQPTDYSDSVETDYSDIPTSTTSNNNTNNPFNGNPTLNNITNKKFLDFSNNDNLYNLSNLDDNARIVPNNSGTRYVEISNPNKNVNNVSGYGKYIDGSQNLISINCLLYFNDTDVSLQQLQQVDFHGWGDISYTNEVSNNSIVPFGNLNVSDMYSSNQQKGFRRFAEFSTANVLIHDLSNAGFIPPFNPYNVSTGYKLQYNLTRTDGNGNHTNTSSQNGRSDFYVDNFPNYADPSYNTDSSSVVVTDISWVMGIPQVSTVDISFIRNHININSEYKYFQSNGLVAEVNSIKANDSVDVYSGSDDDLEYLYLTYSDLNTDGSYNGSFDGSLNYTNRNITSSQSSNTVSSLVVNTQVYNLYTTDKNYDETFSVAHYRDVSSISNYSSVFTSSGTDRIFELHSDAVSDMGDGNLAVDFGSVRQHLQAYDTHTDEIQSYTLPFINGKFTATTSYYPDICNEFNWDGTLPVGDGMASTGYTNSVYDNSSVGIDLSGDSGDYKCIVYEVDKDNSNMYYFNNPYEGINLSYIVDLLFDSTINNVFNASITDTGLDSDDIHVFLTANNTSSNVGRHQLGNLSIPFQTRANWFARSESKTDGNGGLYGIANNSSNSSGMYFANGTTKVTDIVSASGWTSTNTIIPLTGNGVLSDIKLYFFIKIDLTTST